MKDKILNLLKDIHEAKEAIEINDLLGLKTADEYHELLDALSDLVNEYRVFFTKKGKYILLENCPGLKIGRLSVSKKGFGFVILDKEDLGKHFDKKLVLTFMADIRENADLTKYVTDGKILIPNTAKTIINDKIVKETNTVTVTPPEEEIEEETPVETPTETPTKPPVETPTKSENPEVIQTPKATQETTPSTGNTSLIPLAIIFSAIAAGAIITLVVVGRRKKN